MTVGHSTRTLEEFIGLLQENGIELVIDVRTIPRSRHNPQFNSESLPGKLKESGIGYLHMEGLGGLWHTRSDSTNRGWRNLSFRGFADYMQTKEFSENIEKLITLAGKKKITLMCAETLPWRCHRSLIGDALLVRGIPVEHIMSSGHIQPHRLTSFAHVEGLNITYPEEL
jgi:uncharacterized protein (DUF488 family)